jgi:hypothetical protein
MNSPSGFSDLRFSNDGKWMLGVVESKIYVLDAFNGNVVSRFSNGASPDSPYSLEAAFTPDSQFIVSGEGNMIMMLQMRSGPGRCACMPTSVWLNLMLVNHHCAHECIASRCGSWHCPSAVHPDALMCCLRLPGYASHMIAVPLQCYLPPPMCRL